LSGLETCHSMSAATRRRGGSTEKKAGHRCAVEGRRGPKKKLAQIHSSSGKIASNQIRIPAFEHSRRRDGTGEDAIVKARREAVDLTLNGLEAIDGAAVRNMAVGPRGVLPSRSAGWIKERGLNEQDEWSG
jgi:hypothetical protein